MNQHSGGRTPYTRKQYCSLEKKNAVAS